ncbi:MAG: repressor LexA [Dehalococcoidia bacterium]|nr:repressor LexA [Dehalococcoidia bacterium]
MISDRQKGILSFIRSFLSDRGYPPTIRDIAAGCHISSTSVVDYNLNVLEKKGYLRCERGISRGIGLLGENVCEMVTVPVIGQIAAGKPIPVPDDNSWSGSLSADTMQLPRELTGDRENIYILKVKGNSMVDALIGDGDFVLMQQAQTADDGDMVAVWLKDRGEVTLKKFYREGKRIRLQPSNGQMSPICVDAKGVEIQGRVVCVIRKTM